MAPQDLLKQKTFRSFAPISPAFDLAFCPLHFANSTAECLFLLAKRFVFPGCHCATPGPLPGGIPLAPILFDLSRRAAVRHRPVCFALFQNQTAKDPSGTLRGLLLPAKRAPFEADFKPDEVVPFVFGQHKGIKPTRLQDGFDRDRQQNGAANHLGLAAQRRSKSPAE